MIDFTRAFRLQDTIRPLELERADRALLAKMAELTADAVTTATKGYLSTGEVNAVMKRRDLILTHYRNRVQKLGEDRVLY
jgi:23S rRNA A2030 N6-methylase RlmJ